MLSLPHNIHERSNIIDIKKNTSTNIKNLSPTSEYSLTQNFFDPSKSSPPNDFMIKLHTRFSIYNSTHFCMKVDSLDKE